MMRSLPSAVRSWSMAKRIWISGSALVWFAFLILVLPLPWLIAALCAAGFHELCHMLAVSLCGGRLGGLRSSQELWWDLFLRVFCRRHTDCRP